MANVRQPAVAGKFYPKEANRLRTMIEDFMAQAAAEAENGIVPKAIIGPHAGYVYSGPIAASAYARVAPGRDAITRVLLIGPAHWVPVRGLAASSAEAFATPLGRVPVDTDAVQALLDQPIVHQRDDAHRPEHALEVHLPFLQTVLGPFTLIPLLAGETTPARISEILAPFAGDPATLIVVSSDLSHYQDYDTATRLDKETTADIESFRPLSGGQACGRTAINGLLHLAQARGWHVATVDLRNSGDTAGPKDQVVGYGAYLFAENS